MTPESLRIEARRVLLLVQGWVVRKRIIIGLVAVVVIGVVAFLLSMPKRGTVEYHFQQHERLREQLLGSGKKTVMGHVRHMWEEMRGQPRDWREDWSELDEHERALVNLGYLEERTFVFSNVALSNVGYAISSVARKKSTNWNIFRAGMSGTNGIRVVTVKGRMPTTAEVEAELAARTNK